MQLPQIRKNVTRKNGYVNCAIFVGLAQGRFATKPISIDRSRPPLHHGGYLNAIGQTIAKKDPNECNEINIEYYRTALHEEPCCYHSRLGEVHLFTLSSPVPISIPNQLWSHTQKGGTQRKH